ncbi:hypothetical protein SHA02_04500 [Salisediminibacterium halotolerans]|nr:hypothetical protein SHA02_04500 [Salisediminibacterium halotolerans]
MATFMINTIASKPGDAPSSVRFNMIFIGVMTLSTLSADGIFRLYFFKLSSHCQEMTVRAFLIMFT